METPEIKKKKRALAGWITTIGVHTIIVVLLLIFGFTTPLPKPEPEGISVDLGIPDAGGPDAGANISQPTYSEASQSDLSPDATENSDNLSIPEDKKKQNDADKTSDSKNNIQTPTKKTDDELNAAIAALKSGKGKGKDKTPGVEGEEDGTEGKDIGGGTGIGGLNGLSSGRTIRNEPIIRVDDQSLCGKHLEVLVKVAPSGRVEDVEIRGIAESKTDVYNKNLYEQAVRDIKANATYTPSYTNEYQKATIFITIQCR